MSSPEAVSRASRPPYPDATLAGNLRLFCTLLRTKHGFMVGPGQTALALQAVEAVGAGRPGRLYVALQTVLCSDVSQFTAFDRAFDRFFLPGPHSTRQDHQPAMDSAQGEPPEQLAEPPPAARRDPDRAPKNGAPDPGGQDDGEDGPDSEGSGQAMLAAEDQEDAPPTDQPVRAVASGARENHAAPDLFIPPPDPMRQAARSFLRHLCLGRSRRFQAAARGTRLDLRRTLRSSLGCGGEPVHLRWKRPPRRSPRIVLLLDASRSMSKHAEVTLAFGTALLSLWRRTHVYSFSTDLQDLTPDLDRPPGVLSLQVPAPAARSRVAGTWVSGSWGGGTRIGASLQQFLQEHGDRVLGRDTLVVIASDGLDVGDIGLLASGVAELQRRSAGVLWLNPLAAHPQYQPTARGMQAALPYLNGLTHAASPEEFALLTRGLRLR